MKHSILERYSRDDQGCLIIDIAANRVADLYNDLDRNTPYQKKDLEPGLVEYIKEAVAEIGSTPFVLQFSISEAADDDLRQRLVSSVANYFLYLKELSGHRLMRHLRRMLTLLLAAVFIIIAAVWVNQQLDEQATVWQLVLAEGLTIAGWVSAWEAMATLLLEIPPQLRYRRRFNRIAHATIVFK